MTNKYDDAITVLERAKKEADVNHPAPTFEDLTRERRSRIIDSINYALDLLGEATTEDDQPLTT